MKTKIDKEKIYDGEEEEYRRKVMRYLYFVERVDPDSIQGITGFPESIIRKECWIGRLNEVYSRISTDPEYTCSDLEDANGVLCEALAGLLRIFKTRIKK